MWKARSRLCVLPIKKAGGYYGVSHLAQKAETIQCGGIRGQEKGNGEHCCPERLKAILSGNNRSLLASGFLRQWEKGRRTPVKTVLKVQDKVTMLSGNSTTNLKRKICEEELNEPLRIFFFQNRIEGCALSLNFYWLGLELGRLLSFVFFWTQGHQFLWLIPNL